MRFKRINKCIKTYLYLLLVCTGSLHAQQAVHEVTLYTIPTMFPIRWDNPSTLYKTAKHCFYKTMSLKNNHLLGHMNVCLNSPLVQGKKYLGMTAANKRQRVDLILKEKIGLAILGATLQGEIESEEHIQEMLQVYAERQKLGFITFRVTEAAMYRMLDFIALFTRKIPGEAQPSRYYGGFYWPLYEDEGAGCSAFALAVLAAADLLPAESQLWLKEVDIPMQLIGGVYNQNKHIPFGRILKTKTWYQGEGVPNVDYVHVKTYDPSVLYEWILEKRFQTDSIYLAVEQDGVPGLMVDCTSKVLPLEKPYFAKRKESNLFLDIYRQILLQDASKPTP